LTQAEERRDLRSFQGEVSGWITIPEGATLIPDHHPKGHS